MRFNDHSIATRVAFCFATALLAAGLVVSGMLNTGSQFADGAKKRSSDRRVLIWSFHQPAADAAGKSRAGFLLHGEQTRKTSKQGTRPMGIIAVLVGLKADHTYALRLSASRCKSGGGGGIYNSVSSGSRLVGRGIRFTSGPDGTAYLERKYRLTRKAHRRAKSVLLLEGDPDRPIVICASKGDTVLGDVGVVRE